eukprot:SAG31_NODE_2649_length_5298_cov_3.570110_3_plen_94_part_00
MFLASQNVNNKFSVKYYLNLVLIDEEDRRYFKQQEIQLWRFVPFFVNASSLDHRRSCAVNSAYADIRPGSADVNYYREPLNVFADFVRADRRL